MPRDEISLPELLDITLESLNGDAAYLRVMALGRPEMEAVALQEAADKICDLGATLENLIPRTERKS
jgi:hypothetical protein